MLTLPTTLSEAMAGIDWNTETTSGAQRIVFFADNYVVKYDPAETSNRNELAWYDRVPSQVAECHALEIDVDLSAYGDLFGHFLVMERAENVGDEDVLEDYCCWECSGADELDLLCSDDLHSGNIGTMPDGRLVAIDMGCCHPTSREQGYFGTRYSNMRNMIAAIAEAFGVDSERIPEHYAN